MNRRKLAKIVLAIAVVVLLAGAERAWASHTVGVSISPEDVGAGVTRWFWMAVGNDAESQHAIMKIELILVDEWEAVSNWMPVGWLCTINTAEDTYTWEALASDFYIAPGEVRGGFDWKATAPTTGGVYTMTVTTTDTNDETDTDTFDITVTVLEYPLGLAAVFTPSLGLYLLLKKRP